MIGVDVVDLGDPLLKPRTGQHLRFLAHPDDNICIDTDENLHFWLCWAAKEAVFKAARTRSRFVPSSIEIKLRQSSDSEFNLSAAWGQQFQGKLTFFPDKVLALAAAGELDIASACYQLNGPNDSDELRKNCTKGLPTGWQIGNDNGLPVFVKAGIAFPISLSHHHRFGAVAWPASLGLEIENNTQSRQSA